MNGYTGKILFADLSNSDLRIVNTEDYADWIGGRGLGLYLIAQEEALFDPDPRQQPIAISAGPLVNVGVPLGVRTAVSARNQVSGGISYSNVGGDFGIRMRSAGFDSVLVTGASQEPVYLLLSNDQAKIVSASKFWGLQVTQLHYQLIETHQRDDLSFIGIGPGGENQAAVSCLIVDKAHAAGWGGSGAIFGAKNLKAVVAIGSKPVGVFDTLGLKQKADQLSWRIKSSEAAAGLVRGGTHGMAGAGGFSGLVPTGVKNLSDEYLTPEESAPIREETFRQWEKRRTGCLTCQIKCLHWYEMESSEYGSLAAEGLHANSVRGLASNLGIDDPGALLAIHHLCNEYSLDVDGVSAAVAFALECAENEIMPKEHPGKVYLEWGNGPGLVNLVRQMGEAEGLGKILNQGVHRAAEIIGEESKQYAMTTKKVGINEQGLRSHRAWALGVIASSRGGGHLGGSPQTENRRISEESGQKLFNNPQAGNPASYQGKGELAAWTEGLKAVIDSLGLCYFVFGWYDLSFGNPAELAELLNLATGQKISGDEIHQIGLRIHTLERYLNYLLAGYDRADDTLPDRFFDTAISNGPYQGERLDRDEVEKALSAYYLALGWDVETGLPSEKYLAECGLGFLLTQRN